MFKQPHIHPLGILLLGYLEMFMVAAEGRQVVVSSDQKREVLQVALNQLQFFAVPHPKELMQSQISVWVDHFMKIYTILQ